MRGPSRCWSWDNLLPQDEKTHPGHLGPLRSIRVSAQLPPPKLPWEFGVSVLGGRVGGDKGKAFRAQQPQRPLQPSESRPRV